MDNATALAELNKLKGYSVTGSLLLHESEFDALYMAVCGKHLRNCKCKDRLNDALIEIHVTLKKQLNEMKNICRLRKGVVIMHVQGYEGKVFNHTNITDDVARAYLAQHPEKAVYFDVLPEAEPAKVEESPENGTEMPADGAKEAQAVSVSTGEETPVETPKKAKRGRKPKNA